MAQSFIIDCGTIALGLVLLRSFIGKLQDVPGFLRGVQDYRLLPAPLARAYGLAVIPIEGLVAACLLVGWQRALAGVALLALLLSFSVGVVAARRQHLDIACHCFEGDDTERVSRRTLARLGLLVLLGVLVLGAQLVGDATPGSAFALGWLSYCMRVLGAVYLLILGAWTLAALDLVPGAHWLPLRAQRAR